MICHIRICVKFVVCLNNEPEARSASQHQRHNATIETFYLSNPYIASIFSISPLQHSIALNSILLPLPLLPLSLKQPLESCNRLPSRAEEIPKSKAPAADAYRVDEKVDESPVTNTESQEDPKILPLVSGHDVERGHVVNSGTVHAIPAIACCVWIQEIPCTPGYEIARVGLTRRAGRRVEIRSFGSGATHGRVVQCGGENAPDPVSRGVEIVEPVAPEDGELGVGAYDAVEEGEHDEEEGEDIRDNGE